MAEENVIPEPIPSPDDTRADVKCAVTKTCTRYLEDLYGRARMESVVRRTGMSVAYLSDPHNWISYSYFCHLLDALVEETGDPMASYKQALLTNRASTSAMGSFLAHLGSPGSFYRLAVRFARVWCRDVTYRMLESGRTQCTISVSNDLYPQTKNNCLAIQGCLASVPTFFGYPLATVQERQCACDGTDACIYEITWTEPGRRFWPVAGLGIGAAIGLGNALLLGWSTGTGVTLFLTTALGYALAKMTALDLAVKENQICAGEQAQALLETIAGIEELNAELQDRVETRTRELTQANESLSVAISDLKASRKKALRAEREAAVGSLAAGMARELNNPLNALHLCVEALRAEASGNEGMEHLLDIAARSSQRCRRVVNELLSCAREPNRDAGVQIDQVVRSAVSTFQAEQLGSCRVNLTVQSDLPPRSVDGLQVQQALLILLSNASRAVANGGCIQIVLERKDADVVLSVTDSDPGTLGNAHGDRVDSSDAPGGDGALEPGLAIARQIVSRNGGTVKAYSHPDGSITLELRFPAEQNRDGEEDACERDGRGCPDG